MIRDDILLRTIEQLAAAIARVLGRSSAIEEHAELLDAVGRTTGLSLDALVAMPAAAIHSVIGFPPETRDARVAFVAWALLHEADRREALGQDAGALRAKAEHLAATVPDAWVTLMASAQ